MVTEHLGRQTPPESTPDPPASAGGRLPDHLGEVDVLMALRRLEGDADLYRHLVADFVATEATSGARIGGALDAGDLELATRLAHTLRGLAAMVGAGELAARAAMLEKSLRAGNVDEGRQELGNVEGRLREVVRLLGELIGAGPEPRPAPQGPSSAVDVARAQDILRETTRRLAEGRPDAADCVRDLAATLPGTEFAPGVNALARALDDLDFEAAQQAARGLAAKLRAG